MNHWDGTTDVNSKDVALIEIWLMLLKKRTFSDEFGGLTNKFLNKILYRERNFYRIYINIKF